jgi:hypothetical protein
MSVNKTLRLFLFVIFTVAAAMPASATEPISDAVKHERLADMARGYLAGTSQSNLAINAYEGIDGQFPSSESRSALDNYLGSTTWHVTYKELYKDGGWILQFYDRLISIRPGFVRGSVLGGAYTTEPVAIIADITGLDYGEVSVYDLKFLGHKGCYLTPSGSFYFAFTTNMLTASKCINGQPDPSLSKEIPYKEWINVWAQNATKYCGTDVANYCFMPQRMATHEYYGEISRWTLRYGYVASKGSPMGGAGGQPADFLELMKWNEQDDWVFAQNKNSPPLRLTFQYVPRGSQIAWDIYEITKEELKAAEESWKPEEHASALPENTPIQPTPALPTKSGYFLENK